jgi:hypothetical protein
VSLVEPVREILVYLRAMADFGRRYVPADLKADWTLLPI